MEAQFAGPVSEEKPLRNTVVTPKGEMLQAKGGVRQKLRTFFHKKGSQGAFEVQGQEPEEEMMVELKEMKKPAESGDEEDAAVPLEGELLGQIEEVERRSQVEDVEDFLNQAAVQDQAEAESRVQNIDAFIEAA